MAKATKETGVLVMVSGSVVELSNLPEGWTTKSLRASVARVGGGGGGVVKWVQQALPPPSSVAWVRLDSAERAQTLVRHIAAGKGVHGTTAIGATVLSGEREQDFWRSFAHRRKQQQRQHKRGVLKKSASTTAAITPPQPPTMKTKNTKRKK